MNASNDGVTRILQALFVCHACINGKHEECISPCGCTLHESSGRYVPTYVHTFTQEQKDQIKAYIEGKTMSEEHVGIIRIADGLLREVIGDTLTIDATDTQGTLRDKGVFAEVRKRLLLPETYTVHNIFYEWMRRTWCVVIEGPDLPLAVDGLELPYVTPIYQRNEDGAPCLVRIEI